MAWLDDLEARAAQSYDNAQNSVGDWIDSTVSEQVVKVGDKALGNQTALEIAQGQAGAPTPIKPGQGLAMSANAMAYPTIAGVKMNLPIMLALGVAAYFVFKKMR